MDLNSILSPATSAEPNLPQSKELDKDSFMKLLVSQLQNQDPMEPVKNENFVAQLATFSNLEQMEQVNDGITGLLILGQAETAVSQLAEGSALIGKQVGWTDPDSGAGTSGIVESVKVENGVTYLVSGQVSVPILWVNTVNLAPAEGDNETPSVDEDVDDSASSDNTNA